MPAALIALPIRSISALINAPKRQVEQSGRPWRQPL
jgi:hypothetical protein